MLGKTGDKIRLQHILDALLEIESHIKDSDIDDCMDNSMMRFACI